MSVVLSGEKVARKRQNTVTVTAHLYMPRPPTGSISCIVSLNPLKVWEVVVALAKSLGSYMLWGSRRVKRLQKIVLTLQLFVAISQGRKLGTKKC